MKTFFKDSYCCYSCFFFYSVCWFILESVQLVQIIKVILMHLSIPGRKKHNPEDLLSFFYYCT